MSKLQFFKTPIGILLVVVIFGAGLTVAYFTVPVVTSFFNSITPWFAGIVIWAETNSLYGISWFAILGIFTVVFFTLTGIGAGYQWARWRYAPLINRGTPSTSSSSQPDNFKAPKPVPTPPDGATP